MREENLRPLVIVYETRDKSKYDHLKSSYRLHYSNPLMFSIPQLKYDYFISTEERIKREYREYGVPDLLLELSKESKPVKSDPVPTPTPVVDNATTDVSDSDTDVFVEDSVQEDSLEDLSWAELRAKAIDAGLEGRFGKEAAIEFLKNK